MPPGAVRSPRTPLATPLRGRKEGSDSVCLRYTRIPLDILLRLFAPKSFHLQTRAATHDLFGEKNGLCVSLVIQHGGRIESGSTLKTFDAIANDG